MQQECKILENYLRLQCFPVAIKMLKKDEKIAGKYKKPMEDLKIKLAICQAVSISRRYGWSLLLSGDDISCPLAKIAFGFRKSVEYYEKGNVACGMYTETLQAGEKTEKEVPKFLFEEYEKIAIAPLARIEFSPDLIMIYGNSAQIMRLISAALYKNGGYLNSKISSRFDCAFSIIETIQTMEYQVIIPCYGDRVFGLTQDDEVAFTIPFIKLKEILYGLEETHKNGIRYPIPSFLRFTAEYPKNYEYLNTMIG